MADLPCPNCGENHNNLPCPHPLPNTEAHWVRTFPQTVTGRQVLVPTTRLRWLTRAEPDPMSPGVVRKVKVLQQGYTDTFGAVVWRDVPTEETTDE